MSNVLRADCIRCCIGCFKCLGKPLGAAGRATAVLCGVRLFQLTQCCIKLMVLVVLVVASFLFYVYWDDILEATSVGRNATVGFYNATKHQITSAIEKTEKNAAVQNFANHTEELLDNAKQYVDDAIEKIKVKWERAKVDEAVAHASNKTAEFWNKIWG